MMLQSEKWAARSTFDRKVLGKTYAGNLEKSDSTEASTLVVAIDFCFEYKKENLIHVNNFDTVSATAKNK